MQALIAMWFRVPQGLEICLMEVGGLILRCVFHSMYGQFFNIEVGDLIPPCPQECHGYIKLYNFGMFWVG